MDVLNKLKKEGCPKQTNGRGCLKQTDGMGVP